MFESLFSTEMALVIQFCLAFLILLGLIGVVTWAVRSFLKGGLEATSAGGRQSRLSIVDSASLVGSRRLILIRRDGVEHLLMIGGPTEVIIETNIARAVAVPHEVPKARSPIATEPPPGSIPLPGKGSRLLLPKPATIPSPAPGIESLPEEPALPVQPQAQALTRPQRDMLAALADELSTRRPAPGKNATAVARPRTTEPRAELRPEPQLKPEPEPRIATPHPVEADPATAEIEADEGVADMTGHLETALRRPDAAANTQTFTSPPRAAPAPQQARSADAATKSILPARTRGPSEPTRPRAVDRTPPNDLASELARLLGR